jgi:hypothetical protein
MQDRNPVEPALPGNLRSLVDQLRQEIHFTTPKTTFEQAIYKGSDQ